MDGVYDSDPKQNHDAKRYKSLTYTHLLTEDLRTAGFWGDNGMSGGSIITLSRVQAPSGSTGIENYRSGFWYWLAHADRLWRTVGTSME